MPNRYVHVSLTSVHFNNIPIKLYHGTTSFSYESLMDGISVDRSHGKKDFGKGFYLTSNFDQASIHADKRALFDEEPIVCEFSINIPKLKSYDGKVFNNMDVEWAKFIYRNRSNINYVPHEYDWVFGGVADSRFDHLIPIMDNGIMNLEGFLNEIRKYPYNQLSIHNQDIFDTETIKLEKVVYSHERSKIYDPRTV